MLLYKNGQFHCGKVSFALPNDCLLLTVEQESYYPFGLTLADTTESYTLDAHFIHADEAPQESLSEIVASVTVDLFETISYEKNGVCGCYAAYHDKHNYYLEFALETDTGIEDEDGEPVNTLSVVIYADSESAIKKAASDTLVWELLDSIQITK